MKKYIILIFGLFITIWTYGQEYYPFPDSNAIWNEFSIHIENPQNVAYKTRYGIIGDTIIDLKQYSKIYSIVDDSCLNINNAEYFGAIREENKRIYTITISQGEQEILLYDFSKEVGDTIYSNSLEGYLGYDYPVIISSIDTVELNDGSHRKRYWLEGGYYSFMNECWIEGVGSIHGLFAPITDILLNYYEPNLSCFKQNGSTVYLNNFSCDKCFCSLQTSIMNFNRYQNKIQIYPNPFSEQINVNIESNNKFSEIIIYNSNGKIIQKFNVNTYPIEIELRELPTGLYLIQLMGNNFKYTEKLLKKY